MHFQEKKIYANGKIEHWTHKVKYIQRWTIGYEQFGVYLRQNQQLQEFKWPQAVFDRFFNNYMEIYVSQEILHSC